MLQNRGRYSFWKTQAMGSLNIREIGDFSAVQGVRLRSDERSEHMFLDHNAAQLGNMLKRHIK